MQTVEGYFINGSLSSNGDLILTPNKKGIEHAKQLVGDNEHQPYDRGLRAMLTDWIDDGWSWVAPENIGALTAAPILSADSNVEDDGTVTISEGGNVYGHMNYAIEDVVETWAEGRAVRFQKG